MAKTWNQKNNREETHRTYGGELTLFDFEGRHTMSSMASKIIRGYSFDEQCRKNIEAREIYKQNRQ